MKIMLLGLMLLAVPAWSQVEIPIPVGEVALPLVGTLDINSLMMNAGPVVAFDQHMVRWGGANVRVLWLGKEAASSPVSLELGVLWQADGQPSGLSTSLGLRADLIADWIGLLPWVKGKVAWVPIPSVEVGPFGGYVTAQKQWLYGLFISKKIGG